MANLGFPQRTQSAPRKLHAVVRAVTADGVDGNTTRFDRLAVLELACGPGRHLVHFAPASLGLDRDPRAVEAVRALGRDAKVEDLCVPGWGQRIAAKRPGGFEAAYLADCLVHLQRPEVALSELVHTLRPGAPVVVVEWVLPESDGPMRGGLARALQALVPGTRAHWRHPEHLRAWPESRWWALLESAGFERQASLLHSFPPGLTARAPFGTLLRSFWPPRTLIARTPGVPSPR